MTKAQKARYMRDVVAPTMKPLFVAFNAEEFSTFSCKTCHGAGAVDKTFTMPNPDLYVLPSALADFSALMDRKPKWMDFMVGEVKPTMARLLGMPEFSPQNQRADAFGCQNCHASK